MSFRFRISVTRVECLHAQVREWGKDEMRLLGFAVSRRGVVFATGYRVLGSFSGGDVREGAVLGPPLLEAELSDDGLEVLFSFWLVEEDGGGVRAAAAALEAELRERFRVEAASLGATAFPRECIPFTAFTKAVLPLGARIEEAATAGRDDEVYAPVDLVLGHAPSGPGATSSTGEVTVTRSRKRGVYDVTLRFRYEKIAAAS